MICKRHTWSLPTERCCLTCGRSAELAAIEAEQNARNARQRNYATTSGRPVKPLKPADAAQAFGRMERNETPAKRRANARVDKECEKAAEYLRAGMTAAEAGARVGHSVSWVSDRAKVRPWLREAIAESEKIRGRGRLKVAREFFDGVSIDLRDEVSFAEARAMVAARDAGASYKAIAKVTGREHKRGRRVIEGWRTGRSFLAKRAKQAGEWDVEAAE